MANVFQQHMAEELNKVAALTENAGQELMHMHNQWLDAPGGKYEFCPGTIYRVAALLELVSEALEESAGLFRRNSTDNSASKVSA